MKKFCKLTLLLFFAVIVCSLSGCISIGGLDSVPEGFVRVSGTTITGDEVWVPASNLFTAGEKHTIPTLLVCDHEVTQGEWKAVMGEDALPETIASVTGNADSNPINNINWYDALVYCNRRSFAEGLTPCYTVNGSTDPSVWGDVPTDENDAIWIDATCNEAATGYRLPTSAEWEWLARAGEKYTYAGSNAIDEVAWYLDNSNKATHEVKTKVANGYGLYDMSGNVWEWCWDWLFPGEYRVIRGGCWGLVPLDAQEVCAVGPDQPWYRSAIVGFRVVRTAN